MLLAKTTLELPGRSRSSPKQLWSGEGFQDVLDLEQLLDGSKGGFIMKRKGEHYKEAFFMIVVFVSVAGEESPWPLHTGAVDAREEGGRA
jgi:hypothetical protein